MTPPPYLQFRPAPLSVGGAETSTLVVGDDFEFGQVRCSFDDPSTGSTLASLGIELQVPPGDASPGALVVSATLHMDSDWTFFDTFGMLGWPSLSVRGRFYVEEFDASGAFLGPHVVGERDYVSVALPYFLNGMDNWPWPLPTDFGMSAMLPARRGNRYVVWVDLLVDARADGFRGRFGSRAVASCGLRASDISAMFVGG